MKKVRALVFETNSSSVNSLAVFTQEAFEKLKNKNYVYEPFYKDGVITAKDIVSRDEAIAEATQSDIKYGGHGPDLDDPDDVEDFLREYEWCSFEEMMSSEYLEVDTNDIVTPGGEELVIVNKYGYDG